MTTTPATLRLALPKGRILPEVVELLVSVGIDASQLLQKSRRMKFSLPQDQLEILVIRDADIPTYVAHGAVDLGVAGLDVIEEEHLDLYQPLDLGIGRCRLCVAAPAQKSQGQGHGHLRYATKYPNLTQRYLRARNLPGDIIALSGAVEVGPLVGIADRIVDLVSSGETLKQHNLTVLETIMDCSAQLIVNRAAMKVHAAQIIPLIRKLESRVSS